MMTRLQDATIAKYINYYSTISPKYPKLFVLFNILPLWHNESWASLALSLINIIFAKITQIIICRFVHFYISQKWANLLRACIRRLKPTPHTVAMVPLTNLKRATVSNLSGAMNEYSTGAVHAYVNCRLTSDRQIVIHEFVRGHEDVVTCDVKHHYATGREVEGLLVNTLEVWCQHPHRRINPEHCLMIM